MIYRLNRVPEKAYVEFLNLIGVKMDPPSAAAVTLRFRRATASSGPVRSRGALGSRCPPRGRGRGPRVRGGGGRDVAPRQAEAAVRALHGERRGRAHRERNGLPGQAVVARRPPIMHPRGTGSSSSSASRPSRARSRSGRTRASTRAGRSGSGKRSGLRQRRSGAQRVRVDRMSRHVTFAPAVSRRGPDGLLVEPARALAAGPAAAGRSASGTAAAAAPPATWPPARSPCSRTPSRA